MDLLAKEKRPDTPTQARFRVVVTAIVTELNRCPGPTELNSLMGWNGGHDINGWATRIRREVLEANGWAKDETVGKWVRK